MMQLLWTLFLFFFVPCLSAESVTMVDKYVSLSNPLLHIDHMFVLGYPQCGFSKVFIGSADLAHWTFDQVYVIF